MTERQQELLIEMVTKIDEARTYNLISGVLTFLWLFEFIYLIFWDNNLNITLYFTIWLVCMVGWVHMDRKFKKSMKEYNELKDEYITEFGDENI
jgi:hypothetical protein